MIGPLVLAYILLFLLFLYLYSFINNETRLLKWREIEMRRLLPCYLNVLIADVNRNDFFLFVSQTKESKTFILFSFLKAGLMWSVPSCLLARDPADISLLFKGIKRVARLYTLYRFVGWWFWLVAGGHCERGREPSTQKGQTFCLWTFWKLFYYYFSLYRLNMLIFI